MTTSPPDHGRPDDDRPDDDRPDDDRTALRPGGESAPTLSQPASSTATSLRPGPMDRASSRGRGRRSRAPFVVVVCALAIILGMAGGIAFVVRYGGAAAVVGGASPTPSAPQTDPAAVVRGYLHALARGDATGALQFGQTQPADPDFLTDEVLGAAVRAHPITEINVPAVPSIGPTPDETTRVEASYLIGDERVTTSFDLVWVGQRYRLKDTTSTWDVSSLRSKRVPLRIAGKQINSDSVTLLPGAYPITTGLTYLTWGNDTLLVKKPDTTPASGGFRLTINQEGRRALRAAVKADLSRCVAVRKTAPSGCPFAYTGSGYDIKDTTIRWAFSQDPLKSFTPRLSYDQDGVGQVSMSLKLTFKAKGVRTYDDKSMNVDDTVITFATATADLTKDTVTITWAD